MVGRVLERAKSLRPLFTCLLHFFHIQVSQLRHDLSMKDELLQFYTSAAGDAAAAAADNNNNNQALTKLEQHKADPGGSADEDSSSNCGDRSSQQSECFCLCLQYKVCNIDNRECVSVCGAHCVHHSGRAGLCASLKACKRFYIPIRFTLRL